MNQDNNKFELFYERLNDECKQAHDEAFGPNSSDLTLGYFRGIRKCLLECDVWISLDKTKALTKLLELIKEYQKEEEEAPIKTDFMKGYYKAINDVNAIYMQYFEVIKDVSQKKLVLNYA